MKRADEAGRVLEFIQGIAQLAAQAPAAVASAKNLLGSMKILDQIPNSVLRDPSILGKARVMCDVCDGLFQIAQMEMRGDNVCCPDCRP